MDGSTSFCRAFSVSQVYDLKSTDVLLFYFMFRVLSVLQEREEWVAELRVASRVVPLEEHFELQALLRKGAFASVSA